MFRSPLGIMPALDVASLDIACTVAEATSAIDGIVAFKLGLTCTLQVGLAEAVRTLKNATDLPIIYDHQKAGADVPDMAAKFSRICKDAGADGLILFPVAGPTAVKQFVGQAIDQGLLPIVGGDLPLPDYNAAGGGYLIDDSLLCIFRDALALGADHFVVPATDTDKLQRVVALLNEQLDEPAIFMPGIGALGGSISTAFAAAPGCRRYAVVGRAIYDAPDPAEAAQVLANEALTCA